MNRITKSDRGQSVVEVIVALGIFVVAVSAAFQVFFGGQKVSIDSSNASLATDFGQEAVEAVRNIRSRNWGELTTGSHGLVFQNGEWAFASTATADSHDLFTRTVEIGNTEDENIKIATTTVTWETDGRQQTVVIVENLTNWEAYTQSSCKSEELTGNWALPVSLASGDIGPGNSGTDVVVKLPYIYMSGVAPSSNKPDIFVFEYSTTAPSLVAELDIGSGGINQIFLKGNYVYAASANDSKELIIFDISDPLNISEVGSLNLTGTADGLNVIVFGNTVAAVGRTDAATDEFSFIDVSNPASPTVISELGSDNGDVNDFAISGNRLFTISEESDQDVWIFDISNPSAPTKISTYDIEGTTEDLSVYFQERGGTTLLVGNEQYELISIGATNTAAMYVRDRATFGGPVNDITCVGGDLAFLATEDSNKEFLIVDISDPDNLAEYAFLNYPANATGIDFASNMVFMAVRSNDALRIVTSTP